MVFSCQSSIRTCQILKGMCWIPGKTDRKNAWALLLSLLLHAPTTPDRIGYVHGSANIRLGSLKCWLPMNYQKLPELLEIEFEAMLPGRKKHDQRYSRIHTASDYSKFSRRNRERTVGGRSGGLRWGWILSRFRWHHLPSTARGASGIFG